jgi:plastocyanin
MLRPIVATLLLGAAVGSVLAAGMGLARAEEPASTVSIDNFTFSPKQLKVKAGTTVTWRPNGNNSARYRLVEQRL